MHGAAARREGASAAELDAAVGLVALEQSQPPSLSLQEILQGPGNEVSDRA